MGKAQYKVFGGKLIKVELNEKNKKIENIKITGDFFLHPEELIEEMEETLKTQKLIEAELASILRTFLEARKATLLGASPEDFAKCIILAGEIDA
jgi:lipoate-protein ligase A